MVAWLFYMKIRFILILKARKNKLPALWCFYAPSLKKEIWSYKMNAKPDERREGRGAPTPCC